MCHSLWGVWVEIGGHAAVDAGDGRHSLWGVWVEIVSFQCLHNFGFVTPFGECGLKFTYAWLLTLKMPSLPLGSVGWNHQNPHNCCILFRHSLWGVWVEIGHNCIKNYTVKKVNPFGECGLKSDIIASNITPSKTSLPLGSVGWNRLINPVKYIVHRHSLWGVWVEIYLDFLDSTNFSVTPFGECGLKSGYTIICHTRNFVTPFGECGLKY